MPIDLGTARGKIVIDTNTGEVRITMQRDMAAITKSMGDAGKQADSLGDRLKKLGNELSVVSIGAGLLATQGIRAAASVQQVDIRFRSLAGSQKNADKLMQVIANRAKELGLPIQQAQAAFAGLIPTIGKNQQQIEKYVGLAARLSTLNPGEGLAGSIFSIREAISSGGTDLVSLAERFNLPKKRLRELVEQTGDFGKALDIVLNEMGATEAASKEFGKSFTGSLNRFIDAGNRALSSAFTPLLEKATPLLSNLADQVERFAEQNPEFVQMAANVTLVVAAAAPLLLTFGKLVSLGQTLAGLNLGAGVKGAVDAVGGVGGLAKLGVLGAAAGVGTQIGLGLVGGLDIGGVRTRAEQQGTTVSAVIGGDFQNVIGILVTVLGNLTENLVAFVGQFINAAMAAVSWLATLGERIQNSIAQKGFKSNAEVEYDRKIAEILPTLQKYQSLNSANLNDAQITQMRKMIFEGRNPFSGGFIEQEFKTQNPRELLEVQLELERQLLSTVQRTQNEAVAKINLDFAKEIKAAGLTPFRDDQSKQAFDFVKDLLTKRAGVVDPNKPLFDEEKFRADWNKFIGGVLSNTGLLNRPASASVRDGAATAEDLRLGRLGSGPQQALDDASIRKGAEIGAIIRDVFNKIRDGAESLRKGILGQSFSDDQIKAFEDFNNDRIAIEQKGKEDLEAASVNHKERMADIERQGDEAIQAIHDGAKNREVNDARELAQKREDVAANVGERLAEEEANAGRERERILADGKESEFRLTQQYNNDLLGLIRDRRRAASNLDARAVGAVDDRKVDLDNKFTQDRANNARQVQQRLQEQQAEHDLKLAQIRAAGDKEVAQFVLQQQRREQTQVIADGIEIQRINTKREQQRQLEETAYTQRVAQIVSQTTRELTLRETAFKRQFDQLAGHEYAKLGIERSYQAAAEAGLRAWWERQRAILSGAGGPRAASPGPTQALPRPGFGYATGTPGVPRTGLATVHQGERIFNPMQSAMINSMLGGNPSNAQVLSALGGKANRSYVWSGDLVLGDVGNHSLEAIGALVDEKVGRGFDMLADQLEGKAS